MIKNYIKTAARNILRNKVYSFINIFGLAIGVALFIIISLYIYSEYKVDNFNEKKDQIYRLEKGEWAILGPAFGPGIKSKFPEVKEAVRFDLHDFNEPLLIRNNKSQRLKNVAMADPEIFDVFTINFITGDKKTALTNKKSIVLTQSLAKKLFGDQNPIGEVLEFDKKYKFKVTGVIEDVEDFHINISAIVPFEFLVDIRGGNPKILQSWGSWNHPTYYLLNENVNVKELEEKINTYVVSHFKKIFGSAPEPEFFLRPLDEIYFANDIKYELGVQHGNKKFIYTFIAIAIFILVIACINFINLTTVKAASRAKEVGLRKVIGGYRKQLIYQFLSESIFIAFLAFFIALIFVELLLPEFNYILQGNISKTFLSNPIFWLLFIGGILIVGLISGLYPAFFLTRFKPASALKGEQTKGIKGARFRKALTIFQFIISVVLIIGTVIIFKQVNYMKSKELGFNKQKQLFINLEPEVANEREAFKKELLKHTSIEAISYTAQPAGNIKWQESFTVNGQRHQVTFQTADPGYIDVMGLEMVEGEFFSEDKKSQYRNALVINESAAKVFGWENPVGKKLEFWNNKVKVIGVVKDFHYNSLHKKISPLVMGWDPRIGTANIRIKGDDSSAVSYIGDVWADFAPGFPFQYKFVKDYFDSQYQDDQRFGNLFIYFASFAIIIACLGLYGLSLYSTQQRRKEIGVRKVKGASIKSITQLFLKDFSISVIIANIIAWPLAYYVMKSWLSSFPYRIDIQIWFFLAALMISLLIAVITVSYNTINAARTNPVNALKYE